MRNSRGSHLECTHWAFAIYILSRPFSKNLSRCTKLLWDLWNCTGFWRPPTKTKPSLTKLTMNFAQLLHHVIIFLKRSKQQKVGNKHKFFILAFSLSYCCHFRRPPTWVERLLFNDCGSHWSLYWPTINVKISSLPQAPINVIEYIKTTWKFK